MSIMVANDASKIDALTGLRFFAAAAIVVAHVDIAFGSGSIYRSIPLHQAVSFFFVLSGFILSYRYDHFHKLSFPTLKYLGSRFLKIWPVHILSIVILLLAVPKQMHWLFAEPTHIITGFLNLFLLQSWIGTEYFYSSLNGVAWSISCELFFYFAFPFLRTRITRTVLLGVFLATMVLIAASSHAQLWGLETRAIIYTHPLLRLFEFCLGIYSHHIYRIALNQRLPFRDIHVVGALFLVSGNLAVCQWIFDRFGNSSTAGDFAYWSYCAGACFSFAAFLVICAVNSGTLVTALGSKPLVVLGDASFALYMIHAIVIGVLAKGVGYWNQFSFLSILCIVFVVATFISIVIFYCFELSLKTVILKRRFPPSSWLKLLIFFVTITFLVTATFPDHRYISESTFRERLKDFDTGNQFLFQSGIAIDGVSIQCRQSIGVIKVELALRSTKDTEMTDALGIHLTGYDGTILSNAGRPIVSNGYLKAGQYWVETFILNKNDPALIAGLRVVIFAQQGNQLETVSGTKTEWGGKAALIALKDLCK